MRNQLTAAKRFKQSGRESVACLPVEMFRIELQRWTSVRAQLVRSREPVGVTLARMHEMV